jgi:3-oxoacyl-[acyl-carrier-protein] synthase I
MHTPNPHTAAQASHPPEQQARVDHLYVCDISLLTPLGLTPEFVHAVVKAQICAYQLCTLPGDDEQQVKFAPIPDAAMSPRIAAQIAGMSTPHIRALKIAAASLASLRSAQHLPDMPLFLAGPEAYYDKNTLSAIFIQHLITATGIGIEFASSRYFAAGRAGIFYALDAAFDYLSQHPQAVVLVAGIDTFYDARTLGILEEQKRLTGDGVYDGFVPAEGAVFMLLTSGYGPEDLLAQAKIKLSRPGIAFEPGHMLSEKPHPAHSLSTVITEALQPAQYLIDKIYTSENGESYYAREFTVARLRNAPQLLPDVPICRLAEFTGDMGAAYPGVAIALAALDNIKSQARSILICASSDGGARGALYVSPA